MTAKLEFIPVPMRAVRAGEMFVPIERMGEPVYVVRKRRWERAWIKADRAYVATGTARGTDETGKDGVFSLYDWAIVRRHARPVAVRAPANSAFGDALRRAMR